MHCTQGRVQVSQDRLQEIKQCFPAGRPKLPRFCLTTQYCLTCNLAERIKCKKRTLDSSSWQTVDVLEGCCCKLEGGILRPRCHFQLLLLVLVFIFKALANDGANLVWRGRTASFFTKQRVQTGHDWGCCAEALLGRIITIIIFQKNFSEITLDR